MSSYTGFETEQESFWAGDFGSGYIGRNKSQDIVASNIALFSRILSSVSGDVSSFLEVGANIGLNLRAIHQLLPKASFFGVEINAEAAQKLREWVDNVGSGGVSEASILDWSPVEPVDFAFTKGVLIHISPDHLPIVYNKLYQASKRYILIAEYYNPTPVSIPYRGHSDRLFKRDFAGEMLDLYPDLGLVDYGFVYKRDSMFALDDVTWFLLEKR